MIDPMGFIPLGIAVFCALIMCIGFRIGEGSLSLKPFLELWPGSCIFVVAPGVLGLVKLLGASWTLSILVATGVYVCCTIWFGWRDAEPLGATIFCVIGLFFGGVFGVVSYFFEGTDPRLGEAERENALFCTATVLNVVDTGKTLNKQDVSKIIIRVFVPGHETFERTQETTVPTTVLADLADSGTSVGCRTTEDLQKIELLWSGRVDVQPPQ